MAIRSPLVDAYHARLSPAERKALEQIRVAVHAACPGAEECLSYGMPAVKFEGKPLVGWRAAAKHGAFHPLSGSTVASCKDALADYDTSKGTIRFSFDAVLPARLVKLLVAARIRENRQKGETEKKVGRSPAAAAGRAAVATKSAVQKKVAMKKPPARKAAVKRGAATGGRRPTTRPAN